VIPQVIEFWQQGEFRLHHRERYTRVDESWQRTLLYP
jgi:pyridoxine/pyridoxamine 5'-phosphate oxidase